MVKRVCKCRLSVDRSDLRACDLVVWEGEAKSTIVSVCLAIESLELKKAIKKEIDMSGIINITGRSLDSYIWTYAQWSYNRIIRLGKE